LYAPFRLRQILQGSIKFREIAQKGRDFLVLYIHVGFNYL
jgi:hypothetical protein